MTDLVKRAKKGDKEAFILLMDHHRQMLYNTALLVLHRGTTPWTPSKTPSWPAGKTCPACKRTGTLMSTE